MGRGDFLRHRGGFCIFGVALSRRDRAADLNKAYEQLSAVAQLKSRQISEWRRERLDGARVLAVWQGFGPAVDRWLARRDDTACAKK